MAVQGKTYTAAEFFAIEDLPENADRILELVVGEIVEKMLSFAPSRIAVKIGHYLSQYIDEHPIGYITGSDGGYIMSEGNIFIPDVAFISKARLPQEPEREAPVPPDLAVEVKSPADAKRGLRLKAEKYLISGTRLVWLVFPDEQLVEVYLASEDVRTLGLNDALDGADGLPDFSLHVRAIFA
jgi:Uma2 family endonuclease